MKITISGTAGSGKSTVAKELAKRLGHKHFSMGDLQRELAEERGLTIKELGELEKKDPKLDHMIDNKQKDIGEKEENFVLDSWLAAKFVPHAIKIFLDADIEIRAKRRVNHRRTEESFDSFEEAKKDMQEREKINEERFKKFYDFDITDKENYDIIIDTTELSIEEVVEKVIEEIKKRKNN